MAALAIAVSLSAACGPSTDTPANPTTSAQPSTSPSPGDGNGELGNATTSEGPSSGSGQGNGQGNGTGQNTASWPTPEDCVAYNPDKVAVTYANGFYTVKDGTKVVLTVPGQSGDNTGDKALALTQRYKKHCYLGRNNNREERNSYIFDYWRDASGNKPTIADQDDDCSSYNHNNLTVEDMGNNDGWRVKDHDHVLHLFDNGTDAKNGKLVLVKYSKICFIGAGNDSNTGQDQISYSL
jgi:hypothetical protein